ncbi:DUF4178 domain-containing protein [Bacteriovorax stolpii]|uniref:Uncharacterized protein n=1 Tax=Bacteriovorax stolpii TaxID=960 RepID=A0A2K9NN35_BACTC|nr:DUF4178 domain-containing protein [Bacteriovorax stolpii]AUN96902.1 hypothetical protein C0V70_02025 [Bacteriovorax stolpii]QDK43168.1 DUF4178 domain-containing protein [Bacteriovorax stolpii]TDP53181.1 uncharacterized protein DUF4178 [Bacteriovorax stolpii]
MKEIYTCPSCGADIDFKCYFSMCNTCSSCKSVVVKHGVNLETYGKTSEFPPDLSPLQIGTTGIYKNDHFEIIGRQRVHYDRGFWDEWFVAFENGADGWIAHAQGFYMFSVEAKHVLSPPLREDVQVNKMVSVNQVFYTVDDIKRVTHSLSSGELPMFNTKETKRTSVDLSNNQNKFLNLEYYDGLTKIFQGEYCDFKTFKFQNLKELDGWQ